MLIVLICMPMLMSYLFVIGFIANQISLQQNRHNKKLVFTHQMFYRANDAFYIIDHESFRFLDGNQKAHEALGYTRQELLRMGIQDIDMSISSRTALGHIKSELELVGIAKWEGEHKRKDGTLFPVEINAKYIDFNEKKYHIACVRDLTERKQKEEEKEKLIEELKKATGRGKQLSGFLAICSNCKKIRNGKGSWSPIELYISEHSEASFSHGICPDCSRLLYPDLYIP